MKFSTETIQILKNFATINPNMIFKPGNTLATINSAKSIFARVQIQETIPQEFAIYELNSLLQILTFSDNQEVEFGDKNLTISNDMGSFDYYYCTVAIPAPPAKEVVLEPHFKFELTSKDIQSITKVAGLLAAPNLSIVAKGGKVRMKIGDKKMDTANSFNKIIGEFDGDFSCDIATENLKMITDDYVVTLSQKMACEFRSKNNTMVYLIAMEPSSKM
jgi:hypothetical protein